MNDKIIIALSGNKVILDNLLKSVPEELHYWRSAPDKWSLLEVVCHLVDEEREDFRARTKHALFTPSESMPPIDPVGWVKSRNYAEQDFEKKRREWVKEREQSVDWLKSLKDPDWSSAHEHPKFGKLSAGMFLANWLAHDQLHIRQIVKIQYDYYKQHHGQDLGYAGNW